jgi:hypothetical protein
MVMCSVNIQRVRIMLDNKIIDHVSEFKSLGYLISDHK